MSIYAIGDIQGCYEDLQRLLTRIKFNPHKDKLWFAGDLVNRGPQSLQTLRFIKSLGDAAVCVLGNHDLHLLAVAYGYGSLRAQDTLQDILDAPDKDELLTWLRHRPLFHYNQHFGLLHAGLPPQWDIPMAKKRAAETEAILRSADYLYFLKNMYGNSPTQWQKGLTDTEKLRFTVNCFTRLRFCDADGHLDFKENGKLGSQAKHLQPWFSIKNRKSTDMTLIFGHWSALGYHHAHNCYAIDTGCLWGGQLTALKLGKVPERISIDCQGYRKPTN